MTDRLAVQRKRAAELLDIGVDTFDRYVKPHVPVRYVGNVRLYPVAGLIAYLDRGDRPHDRINHVHRGRTRPASEEVTS